MTRTRAYRRHQHDRAKHRAQWIVGSVYGHDPAAFPTLVHGFTACRKPCSCPVCGNPRKWFGEVTRQEMQAPEAALA